MPEKSEAEVSQAKLRLAYSESTHPTTDSETIEKKRRAAVAGESETQRNDKMIAALLRERAALVTQRKDDRVAQVDEQLKHFGYKGDPAGESGGESRGDARKQPPQGRSAKPQQTGN